MEIDLVFSGSGVKLPAHAGALLALTESQRFEYKRIAGTSGGSIVAAAFWAFRKAGDDLTAANLVAHLAIETDFGEIIKERFFMRLLHFIRRKGMYSGKNFETFVRDKIFDGQLRELPDLHVITSDIIGQRSVDLTERTFPTLTVAQALRRSMSAPFIFTPVFRTINLIPNCFVDGGVTKNYAIDIFDDSERPTIGVNLWGYAKPIQGGRDMKLIPYTIALANTMMAVIEREHIANKEHWDKTIQVNTGNFSTFDFDIDMAGRQELFDRGYNQTKEWLTKHFN